jgi:predicted lipoprotein
MFMKNIRTISQWVKLLKISAFVMILILVSIFLSACKLYTVVKLNQNVDKGQGIKVYFENNDFNAEKYVNKIWDNKAVPYILQKAVDANLVLAIYKKNPDAAGAKYGIRASAEGSPWNYIIKGIAKIIAVNTTSRAGTLDVDLPPYDGQSDLIFQIGPVIKGTSIRDSLTFISFSDFENQIVFAQLGNTLNKKVYDQTLSKTKFETMKGHEIEFTGAFTADGSNSILMIPVTIKAR